MMTLQKHYFHYSKSQWRIWAKAWRNSFKQAKFHNKNTAMDLDTLIQTHLLQLIETRFFSGSRIGVYLPMPFEVEIAPVIEALLQKGYLVFAPCIVQERSLLWREIHQLPSQDSSQWHQNSYGIWEPTPQQALLDSSLDLVLIPAVMMDRTGIRLGYGGGYYDAQLKNWHSQEKKRPLTLGVLYEECVIQVLPCDEWDIPLNGFVTEYGITSIK
jgi:5-formyltetrahydrofolate cyclo-ligase